MKTFLLRFILLILSVPNGPFESNLSNAFPLSSTICDKQQWYWYILGKRSPKSPIQKDLETC